MKLLCVLSFVCLSQEKIGIECERMTNDFESVYRSLDPSGDGSSIRNIVLRVGGNYSFQQVRRLLSLYLGKIGQNIDLIQGEMSYREQLLIEKPRASEQELESSCTVVKMNRIPDNTPMQFFRNRRLLIVKFPKLRDRNTFVFCKTLTGKTLTLHLNTDETVDQAQYRIWKLEGIPPDQQRLTFSGKQMESGRRYGMQMQGSEKTRSTLHLVLKLSGS
mmetsp:Transcript_36994/g.71691  ORF Transcript_36994/g.71691 Transcript_36994/m.71691 type:complete len:218 (+) Transcript_36994:356-1009(+)